MYLFGSAPALSQVLSGGLAAFAPPTSKRALAAPASPAGPAKKAVQVPTAVKVYASSLTALAVLLLASSQFAFPASARVAPQIAESSWTLPLVFAGLMALALLFPIHLARSSKLVLEAPAHFAALLLFGPVVAMLMAGLGAAVGNLTLLAAGKRGPWSVLFNTAKSVLALGAAGAVSVNLVNRDITEVLDGGDIKPMLGLVATAATMYLVGTFPTSVAIGLQHRKNPIPMWLKARRSDYLQTGALCLIGLLAALTVHDRPWTLLVMVMPVAPIYVTLQRTAKFLERRAEDQTVAAVEAMADTVDMRDHYTFEHSKRVARYAVQLAEGMGLSAKEVETIRLAARVHDLGKIGVPDHVLRKPGPLTAEEWELMERHVQIGYDILSRFADFKDCRQLVLMHHERADGAGYPNAMNERSDPEGYRLLRGAQIIAVADALDAMTSDRPYRSALTLDAAMSEFRRHKGQQWLPEVVEMLEELVAEPAWRNAMTGGQLAVVPAHTPAPATGFPTLATA